MLEAAIMVGKRKVRVMSVHLLVLDYNPPEGLPYVARTVRVGQLRDEQTAAILRRVRREPGPVVIGGDFNNQPFGPRYRRLSEALTDSFRATSFGFGYTNTASMPAKRVDYLWTRDLHPLRSWVVPAHASDHRPVVAEFGF